MQGYDAFRMFYALVQHFQTEAFDFFKYNGKVKISLSAYKNSNTFYIFEKLASIHPRKEKFLEFVLANILVEMVSWPGLLLEEEAKDNHLMWRKKIDSLGYLISQDCVNIQDLLQGHKKQILDLFKVPKGGYPPIIQLYIQHLISLETFVILNETLHSYPLISKYLPKQDFLWSELSLKSRKYYPFLSLRYDKMKVKKILKEKLQCSWEVEG